MSVGENLLARAGSSLDKYSAKIKTFFTAYNKECITTSIFP